MSESDISRELLLELALATGRSLDMDTMLREALPVYARKLGCPMTGILRSEDGHLNQIASVPSNLSQQQDWQTAVANLPVDVSVQSIRQEQIGLFHFYAFALPDFGLLLLGRRTLFKSSFIRELEPVVGLLGRACSACSKILDQRAARDIALAATEEKSLLLTQREMGLSLMEATLEATDNGILAVNRQGQITSVNKRFAEMWRIPAKLVSAGDDSQVLQFVVSQLKDPAQFQKKVEQLYDQPDAVSRDKLLFADGRVFERFSHPQRLHDEVVGRVWSFLDVTEQTNAEQRVLQLSKAIAEELERSKRQSGQLQALLSAIPDMVWMKDPQGAIVSCNPAFAILMGVSAQQIIGKTDNEFFPVDVVKTFHAKDMAASQSAVPIVYEEWVVSRKTGYKILLEITKVAVRDNHATLIGVLGVARDVTEKQAILSQLKEAKEEAQLSNDAKSMFLANMSHEIRTPMNAIIGMADLTLNTELTTRQRNYVSKIKVASDGLLRIINDILDFSKIEAGQMQMECIPFELDDVLEQLSSLMAFRAEGQGIELAYRVEPGIPAVLVGDALRLGQILTNLVSNALKFSSGGNVVVGVDSTAVNESQVELHFYVSDEGIGMTDEQVSLMFQPFIQADASTTRRFGGTGLGLAICRHLVGLFGGNIWVESEVGVGSTFHFTARLQHDVDRRQLGVTEFAAMLVEHAHRPVLIVDDSPVARQVLQHLVEQLGLNAIMAESAEVALDKLKSTCAPDILVGLIDWFMPRTDGIETIAQIRMTSAELGRDAPPMILVTAHSQSEALHSVMNTIDGFLTKPVFARSLYGEIARCLGLDSVLRQRSGRRKTESLQWSRFQGLDILLVEDMDINRDVICELLMDVDLSVRQAANGVEALEEVRQKVPDLILMDCHMPVLDGYSATRQLRVNPAFGSLPIIALTASAMSDDKRRCFAAGMNACVTKPVRMEDLYLQMTLCLPKKADDDPSLITVTADDNSFNNYSLPELSGIDLALGLAQVGGRFPLLIRVLRKFRDNLGKTFEPEFEAAIASQEWGTAERLVHSLKGVSRTLGASDLAEAASNLEQVLEQRKSTLITGLQNAVSEQLRKVCEGLKQIDEPPTSPRASNIVSAVDFGRLHQLGRLLAVRDAEAGELAAELAVPMLATDYRTQWESISGHIDRYQYAAASMAMQRLLETIGTQLVSNADKPST
ncbi:MAG TPA: response regulator [Rhodoferax sp.]